MKEIKIEVPNNYEIDKEKSTFENIVFKKIEKKLPMSYSKIKACLPTIETELVGCKLWSLSFIGSTNYERLNAFSALMQLVELRDAWNDGWVADWSDGTKKYVILINKNKIDIDYNTGEYSVLHFKTGDLRNTFLVEFKDLIFQAEELL